MRWSFDFVDGFQGTDEVVKQFHVMVYHPGPPPPPPPHCTNPLTCCEMSGGVWIGGQCE